VFSDSIPLVEARVGVDSSERTLLVALWVTEVQRLKISLQG